MDRLTRNIFDNLNELKVKIGYPDSDIKFNYPRATLKSLLGDRNMSDGELYSALDRYFSDNQSALPDCGYRRGKEVTVIILSREAARRLIDTLPENKLLSELCRLAMSGRADREAVHAVFLAHRASASWRESKNGDFDELITTGDADDPYLYLFTYEERHTEYHRLLPDDYREIYGNVNL